jgi:hypothetical protein
MSAVAMQLHQLAPGCRLALAHELGDEHLGGGKVQPPSCTGSRRRVSGLSVVSHSCSAFISPRPLKRLIWPFLARHAFLAQLVEDGGELALVQRIHLGRRLLAARGHVHAEQRRARHIDVAGSISLGKWRKNSVSSSTWMCEPSTSASLRMQTLP